ncbi:tetratricopeptide repeat protein [Aureliella helgolandensis]|uniref:Tetratricopeptide repeat protein n=2 Tax=Aureliella helgolandensis TaxID=2527968 RepID=A0A518GA49_9BACT|nr:tetratricopeptide repeat protein [Aureliella helgolandensis]
MVFLRLLAISTVGAGAIILIVVLITPLEDFPVGNTTLLSVAERESMLPDRGEVTSLEQSVPTTRNGTLASPNLQLPITSQAIDVPRLQAELRLLAQELVELYPQDPASFHVAAQIYRELKETKLAEENWKKSLSLQPQLAGPYVGLAELLIEAGREPEAIAVLDSADALGVSGAQVASTMALAQENLGELERAVAILEQALEEYPASSELSLAAGRVYSQLGEYPDAERYLRAAATDRSTGKSASVLLTGVLARQGKGEEAKQLSKQLSQKTPVETRPSDEDMAFQQQYEYALREIAVNMFSAGGSIAEHNRDIANDIKYLVRGLELNPNQLPLYMSLASAYRQLGDISTVHRLYGSLVELQPGNVLNYLNYASSAMQLGQNDLAESTLREAVDIDKDGVLAKAALARLTLAKGDYEEAKRLAVEVVERNRSVEAYLLLATVYRANGENGAALVAMETARQIDPMHPQLTWDAVEESKLVQP